MNSSTRFFPPVKHDRMLAIHEILDRVSSIEDSYEQVQWLKQNASLALEKLLRCIYDESIVVNLPEGIEEHYKQRKVFIDETYSVFYKDAHRLKYFIAGHPDSKRLKERRRMELFLEFLDEIHPEDVQYILLIVSGELVNNLSFQTVLDAFPNLMQVEF